MMRPIGTAGETPKSACVPRNFLSLKGFTPVYWVHVWVHLDLKKNVNTLLSDTESMKLFLVRDQEVGGSNPLAPTNLLESATYKVGKFDARLVQGQDVDTSNR